MLNRNIRSIDATRGPVYSSKHHFHTEALKEGWHVTSPTDRNLRF